MKSLILAEKPSLGRNIANAIGINTFQWKDGYMESADYIVSWGFGHLFGLLDIEEYLPEHNAGESKEWTLEGLPFKPKEFKYGLKKKVGYRNIDSGVRRQFGIIKKLCSRPDISYIIHAGDADREGEIIIRTILQQANNQKPVMRLWLPEQTEESIRKALKNLSSDSIYDNLANEGYARTYIDWLYGVNLTRLATIKSGTMLRVGRVIVPIVKAIYDRDMEIKNFVPEKYLCIVSDAKTKDIPIHLQSKAEYSLEDRSKAESMCDLYNATFAVVSNIVSKVKTIEPGKLFSLSKLQGFLGKKYKMTPSESLKIVQALYEAGYITYPRTNTEYLAEAEKGRVDAILLKLRTAGYAVEQKHKKQIYDDKKIESHSALTPTLKLANKEDLNENEWLVYSTILNRFLAVFCSNPCTVNHTTVTIDVGDWEQFTLTEDIFLTRGWMEYEESSKKDKLLPQLAIGDVISTDFKVVEKETSPPSRYTSETLNQFMKNPFRKKKSDSSAADTGAAEQGMEDEEYKAMFAGIELGTEATRTGIINNAIQSKYIRLKNDTYSILPGGIYYIETLEQLGICLSKEKSAEMGKSLKKVYRGELPIDQCVDLVFKEILSFFIAAKAITVNKGSSNDDNRILGKCPICGGDVMESNKTFSCSNRRCGFVLFKDNKLLKSLGKTFTGRIVSGLLAEGKFLLKKCKSEKKGNIFDCYLTLVIIDNKPELNIYMPTLAESSLGPCPKCGGYVLQNKFGNYSCSNRKLGCKFTIYGSIRCKTLSEKNISDLLNKKKTGVIKGFTSISGNTFDARLILDDTGKIKFLYE